MTRKRIQPAEGALFAVPLIDGTFGLGHIAVFDSEHLEPSCMLFAARAAAPEELMTGIAETLRQPIGAMVTNARELRSGRWPIVGWHAPSYQGVDIPRFMDMKHPSYTFGVLPEFIEAYHGLRPWDEYPETPKWYSNILLPGVGMPPTVRYQRDFAPSAQSAPAAQPAPPPQVTEGPAEIHIAILYPGKGLPTVEQLHKRQELERRLEEENAGEITDAGGGEGVMDIYLETEDVQRAMPIVEQLVSELGLAADTLIEAGPVDEDGVDKDDERDEEEEDDDE